MRTPLKQKFWLILISLLVSLLLLELGIRTLDIFRGFDFFSQHRNDVLRLKHSTIPFRTFGPKFYQTVDGVRFITSTHGELFPLKKEKDVFRIVCFGGSTTENRWSLSLAGFHYPLLLQSELRDRFKTQNIEVINVGFNGYATPHSLILLELDVLSWEPDLVILSHNINDLKVSYWTDFTFDYSNTFSDKFYKIPDFESVLSTPNLLFQHSQLYWFISHRLEKMRHKGNIYPIQRKSQGNEPNPLALNTFKRNLESFISLAHARNIKVLLGTQALYPKEEFFNRIGNRFPYNDKVIYPLHEELIEHHRVYNKMIATVAKERSTLFVDNGASLEGREEFFMDHIHYTPEGVRQLVQNYVHALGKSGVMDHLLKKPVIPVSP